MNFQRNNDMSKTMEMFRNLRKYWNRLMNAEEEEPKGDDYIFVKDDFKLYELGGTWGNKIQFLDFSPGERKQDVCGWKPFVIGVGDTRPNKGDVLKATMQNGIITVWVFQSVKYESNPDDMFFAEVVFGGYDEHLENLLEERDELRES